MPNLAEIKNLLRLFITDIEHCHGYILYNNTPHFLCGTAPSEEGSIWETEMISMALLRYWMILVDICPNREC
jgi:hypothetical protein